MTDISKRIHELRRLRREKVNELMNEFDQTVYIPTLKNIIKDCEKEGHVRGQFHNNGLDWVGVGFGVVNVAQ